MHNNMHDANNHQNPIVELIVEEPINFSGGGIRRKQVFFGYDNVAKIEDSWAFMKEVFNPWSIIFLEHSNFLTTTMIKTMTKISTINFSNISVQDFF